MEQPTDRADGMTAPQIVAWQRPSSPVAALFRGLKTMASRIPALWRRRGRQRRALADRDAHLLRDIGVTASDVGHKTRKSFWR